MKEELLKIAQESLSSDEVTEIVKEKFMKSSLADIWGEPLIQESPKELRR